MIDFIMFLERLNIGTHRMCAIFFRTTDSNFCLPSRWGDQCPVVLMRVWIPASESLYLIALSSANYEAMTFTTNLALQVTEGCASEDLSAALSSVVTSITGFAVVNLENLLGCSCHNKLLLVPILYSSIIPRPPQICTIYVIYFT